MCYTCPEQPVERHQLSASHLFHVFFLEEDLLKSTNNIYRIVEKKDIRNTVRKIEERNRENPRQPKIYIYAKLSGIDLIGHYLIIYGMLLFFIKFLDKFLKQANDRYIYGDFF